MFRRLVSLSAAAVVLIAVGLFVASPAYADGLDANCTGTESRHFEPGLTLTTQQETGHNQGTLFACTSTDPGVTYATYGVNFVENLSCLSVVTNGASVNRVITWSDATTSTLSGTFTAQRLTLVTVITLTGSITAGKFQGDTGLLVTTAANPDLVTCALGAVHDVTGVTVLDITSVN